MQGPKHNTDVLKSDFAALLRFLRDLVAPAISTGTEATGETLGAILKLREEDLAVEILVDLLGKVETRVRQALAKRLAKDPHAHKDLILALAADEFPVAEPVLRESPLLSDQDLINLVSEQDTRARCCIADRPHISAFVSAALVASRDPQAMLILLQNDGAEISETSLKQLVAEAKQRKDLQEPLIARREMVSDLAVELYWWMGQELRRQVLSRFEIPRERLDQALQDVLQDMINDVNEGPHADLEAIADQLSLSGKLTPYLMIETLRRRKVQLFATLFSRMTRLTPDAVKTMIRSHGGESLSLACKAIGIEKSSFASIFLLSRSARPDDKVVDPDELSRVLAFYDRMPRDSARTILRQWQSDPSYLTAAAGMVRQGARL